MPLSKKSKVSKVSKKSKTLKEKKGKKQTKKKRSKHSKHSKHTTQPKHSKRFFELPKTREVHNPVIRNKPMHADANISLGILQDLARSKGIPFGGLSKHQLIKKINEYF